MPKIMVCAHCGGTFAKTHGGPGRFCGLPCRFWAKVERRGPDECWPWKGSRLAGYGSFSIRNRPCLTHRVAFQLARGQTNGLQVLHSCDNRPCCNPGHLFLGTQTDNTADMVAKGRQKGGPNAPGAEAAWPEARSPTGRYAVLTTELVRRIRWLYAKGDVSQRELAERFGIAEPTLACVTSGASWKDAGGPITRHWKWKKKRH